MKICSHCKEEKPVSDFYTKLGEPIANCKECHKKKVRDVSKEAKRAKRQREKERGTRNQGDKLAALKRWQIRNPGRRRNLRKAYKLRTRRQCPAWANKTAIDAIYALAAKLREDTGEDWHVDHIVPLTGRLVTGLHVHTNLQILPGVDNMRKGNRM